MKKVNTLKDVCNILNISRYKLDKIRFKIIQAYDYAPEFMIHGTNGKKWSLDLFKKYIKANKKQK
tara:strand:- start:648 stop:842 length:195 start_codon:yes stop_codon:yes gene_type:complete